jgi:hypothetical protein
MFVLDRTSIRLRRPAWAGGVSPHALFRIADGPGMQNGCETSSRLLLNEFLRLVQVLLLAAFTECHAFQLSEEIGDQGGVELLVHGSRDQFLDCLINNGECLRVLVLSGFSLLTTFRDGIENLLDLPCLLQQQDSPLAEMLFQVPEDLPTG